MPSIKKIFASSSSKNPYANPQHPTNIASSTPTPATKPFAPQPPAPRPASPRGSFDYLAEAREAVGRDPVTGRRVRVSTQPPPPPEAARGVPRHFFEGPFADPAVSRTAGTSGPSGSGSGAALGGSLSAYGNPNVGKAAPKALGTKYESFVRQMKEMERGAWREPEGGFYAPERSLGEFYGPGFGR